MRPSKRGCAVLAAAAVLLVGLPVAASAREGDAARPVRRAFFGDLHLHTTLSLDAYMARNVLTTPDQAFRFARGEIIPYMGHTVRRSWPLDFMAVTDHAEYLGTLQELERPDDPRWPILKPQLDDPKSAFARSSIGYILRGDRTTVVVETEAMPKIESTAAWQSTIDAANRNNLPGKFTAFIGFEWTAMTDGIAPGQMNNLHRNVIFRGDTAPMPFTALDSRRPEDLWTYLERNRAKGIEAMAIPHNSNASGGAMFDWNDSFGRPIDLAYAVRRSLNEPLVEIAQSKGTSETHPLLSPSDEFANFEIIDALFIGKGRSQPAGSYVRDAYGRGLALQQKIGANPYKFGVEGGSDLHNGLSTSGEDSLKEWVKGLDPADGRITAEDLRASFAPPLADAPFTTLMTASGALTGVWAEENSRASLYDAMRRKETFATSGTRIRVRFFGGWRYGRADLRGADWAGAAYAQGVPMGSDLPPPPPTAAASAPRFLIWAAKDPDGANLDRIQLIKVWLTEAGHQEKIFEVIASGGRKPDRKNGTLPGVGDNVDLAHASYRNDMGASELATVWADPEFDAAVPTAYYLRVLEIPTPRWSTILAAKAGIAPPDGVPATLQERAWSSAIWFTPRPGGAPGAPRQQDRPK